MTSKNNTKIIFVEIYTIISLWSDIVKHHEQLQEIRAIENFSDSDVTVEQGNTKKSVVVNDLVTVVNAMSKLYMIVTVA